MSDEQRILDRFTTLYQDDAVNKLLHEAQLNLELVDATKKPGEAGGPEGPPEPTALQKVGQAFRNISGVGPIPGVQQGKEALQNATQLTEEEKGPHREGGPVGDQSTLAQVARAPKVVIKNIGKFINSLIPGTAGEAGLMYAGGKVISGVSGGVQAVRSALGYGKKATEVGLKLTSQEVDDLNTLNKLKNEEVNLTLDMRSSGASSLFPDQYGGASFPEFKQNLQPAKDITKKLLLKDYAEGATQFAFRGTSVDELRAIAEKGALQLGQDAEGNIGISASTINKEGFPVYGDGSGIISKTGQHSDSGRVGEVLINPEENPNNFQYVLDGKVVSFDELKAKLGTMGGGTPEKGPLPQLQSIIQEDKWEAELANKRKEIGSRITTPNDVSRAIGRELLPTEEAALAADAPKEITSYIFGMANQAEFADTKLAVLIDRYRAGDQSIGGNLETEFQNLLLLSAKTKNALEEGARATQAGRTEDVSGVTKRFQLLMQKQEQLESFQPFLEEGQQAELGLTGVLNDPKKAFQSPTGKPERGSKQPKIKTKEPEQLELPPALKDKLDEMGVDPEQSWARISKGKFELTSENPTGAATEPITKPISQKSKEFIGPKQPKAAGQQLKLPLKAPQIVRLIDAIGRSRGRQAVENAERLGWDMFTSHIYFSELSNPRTWQVNAGVSIFLQPLIQAASIFGGRTTLRKGLSEESAAEGQLANYAPGAEIAHLVGAYDGFMTSVRHVVESWRGGGVRGLMTDLMNLSPLPYSFAESLPAVNKGPAISAENLNRFFAQHEGLSTLQFDPNGAMKPMAWMLDAYGKGAHFVKQTMEAGDRMAYLVNEHAHRASQAFSRGMDAGLEGDNLVRYYKTQMTTPTLLVQQTANKNAMHDIFREDISGSAGMLVRGLGHPLFRPIVTYVRTPVNIASVGFEGFPLLNRAVSHIREDYEAGGARAQLARGRWMVGSTITGLGALLAMNDTLTGFGPLNPEDREAWLADHEPYAIRIRHTGDKSRDWVSLKFIQPVSTWLGLAADMTQMRAWEEQPKSALEYMHAPTVAFSHAFTNTVFTQDLLTFLDHITTKPYQTGEQWARAFEKYAEGRLRGFGSPVPTAASKALQSIFDGYDREIRGIGDAFKSTIPGWAQASLPRKLNFFGDEMKRGASYSLLALPTRSTDTKYTKVTEDIARNAPHLNTIPTVLDNTELTSKDIHDFKYTRGHEVKAIKGLTFGDALVDLVNNNQEYKKGTEGPHGMKAKLLSSYINAYTKMAVLKLAEKDPRWLNLGKKYESIEAITGKKVARPSFLKIQPE